MNAEKIEQIVSLDTQRKQAIMDHTYLANVFKALERRTDAKDKVSTVAEILRHGDLPVDTADMDMCCTAIVATFVQEWVKICDKQFHVVQELNEQLEKM